MAAARRRALLACVLAAGLAVPALALAAPPSASSAFERDVAARLVRAAQAGHRSELARLGARAGARGLRPLLLAADPAAAPPAREVRLAAVLAAPAAGDAWDLLAPLAAHAAGPDRLLAASAAASAAAIAVALQRDWPDAHEAQESAPAALIEAEQRWLDVARDPGRWVDVRVLALETAVATGRVLRADARPAAPDRPAAPGRPPASAPPRSPARPPGDAPGDAPGADPAGFLVVFAADAEPALRRAAYELLDAPLADAERALAARAVAGDADADVALAAAQALCSGLGFGDDPAPVLAALDDEARARLRGLVGVAAHPPAARIDAGRCLAAIGDQPSRRALDALRVSVPRDLRGLIPRVRRQSRRQDSTP
jgi:hypothetical protein